jgi:fatty acid desaturase
LIQTPYLAVYESRFDDASFESARALLNCATLLPLSSAVDKGDSPQVPPQWRQSHVPAGVVVGKLERPHVKRARAPGARPSLKEEFVSRSTAAVLSRSVHHSPSPAETLDALSRRVVSDLHAPRPLIFWSDLLASATIGWAAFAVALLSAPWTPLMLIAGAASGFALYRGLCFTHELTHLRKRSLPGFETAWNVLFGVPLLLPSFTYMGVHQSHHSLSTYGTKADPEYLPFASSRKLIFIFALQSAVLIPLILLFRFVVLSPFALLWPRFHRWLEVRASSFSMNPDYRRVMQPSMARRMRRWELAMLACFAGVVALMAVGVLPGRTPYVWFGVLTFVSFFNTLRVLGAHDYESDGSPRDRYEQLEDSIDTPGGIWTELWAPVGLRYHALHHYFPGIPYHNLGIAYRRIVAAVPGDSLYFQSTSPSLRRSLSELLRKAKAAGGRVVGR